MAGYFTNAITLEDVRAAKPSVIYYAISTCWWTHNPVHLYRHPDVGLPCDPRGSMLLQTGEGEAEKFLEAAEANIAHYGKHGLRAFMAAHHQNCVVSADDQRATSLQGWDRYNQVVDEFDARQQGGAR